MYIENYHEVIKSHINIDTVYLNIYIYIYLYVHILMQILK